MIIDGKKIARGEYKQLKSTVSGLKGKPCLCAFLVGNNSSSLLYIKQKKKWAEKVWIKFVLEHLKESITQEALLKKIQAKNTDKATHGVMVQLPLPKHIDGQKIISCISPNKDVDGFHPTNQWKIVVADESGFVPCTPSGIMMLLKEIKVKLKGSSIVVIGRSNIVGKPIVNLLINAWATVTSCNSMTKDISSFTKKADIVILAVGKPGLLKKSMLKSKSIVIDVGFTVKNGKVWWDAEFESIEKAGHSITPVPGGVWAMTVLCLLQNTLKAYMLQNGK